MAHHPKRLKPTSWPKKPVSAWSWLLTGLAWATAIGFFLVVPPRFWWQIAIGLGLIFACLFFTINTLAKKIAFSLIITGLIILLPILKLIRFLTWPIGLLIGLLIILFVGYFLLEKY